MRGKIRLQVLLFSSLLAGPFLHDVEATGLCPQTEFNCRNGNCISNTLTCNEENNCGDNSDEQVCDKFRCHPSAFHCLNGNCIRRRFFCDNGDDCGDNSDEIYCNKRVDDICPPTWFQCPSLGRCIPPQWLCDGTTDCNGESEEKNCAKMSSNNTSKTPGNTTVETELRSWLLGRGKSGFRAERWGSHVHRIAVALHLADNSTFGPGNSTGEELRYELTMQLFYSLPRNKMSSHDLALYIHALLVACIDPRDFYGLDLVRELRRRVGVTSNYTNPFLILVLCNAGDTMTAKDVKKVTAAYDSQHRPFWTDYQALSSMALSCIASRHDGLVDERTLMNMLQELKKHQFRNGTVGNLRTTALVTQALFIHNSYLINFNLDSAIKVLVDGMNGSKSLMHAYYALPAIYGKSLLNVSSRHCSKYRVDEEQALQKALEVSGETIAVQYSVWMGDKINVGQTWRLRMPVNSTIYDAIEMVAKIDNRHKVKYNFADGKPYVSSLNGKEEDPETGMLWFIYLKALDSEEQPKFVEQSPVDIKLTPRKEIILWYKRAPWDSQDLIQKSVISS